MDFVNEYSSELDPHTIEHFAEWVCTTLTGARIADYTNGDGYNARDEQHYDWALSRALDIWTNDASLLPPHRTS